MPIDVVMPKLGESITEGTILEWKLGVGDRVELDQPLLEISTDKVDAEISAPAAGVIIELLYEPQAIVEVGEVIARIDSENSGLSSSRPKNDKRGESAPEPTPPKPVTELRKPAIKSVEQRFYSPVVRALAAREGLSERELNTISGSGSRGRVTKADLLHYLEAPRPQISAAATPPDIMAPPAVAQSSTPQAPAVGLTGETVPMDRVRRRIAEHMRQSLDTSAHVFIVSEVDMTDAVRYIVSEKAAFFEREQVKLTYTPLIAAACIRAIQDFALINSSLSDSNIIRHRNINLGIAVALPGDNLIVPVVHHAEEFNFLGLIRKVADFSARARAGKLTPDEAAGSTFTITNPGIYGSLYGMPIINQPNVAILAVGAIHKRPVVLESAAGDSIAIRSMMYLSLGHDHRLIDGAYGAQFLERIKYYLEAAVWTEV